MNASEPEFLPTLRLQKFSAADDGMHLEVAGRPSDPSPFITFRADEQLGMQVELYGIGYISFPLAELKRANALAEAEVHPESFYD